ncbi:MAG TPA: redoxin family protein [Myxococcales bacterium]|nr:redoxin family protein [Myxococcales bacterium]
MIALLAALLLAAPTSTVRLRESGSALVGSPAPVFGGWDLSGSRVLTLQGMRRTPYLAPLLITFVVSSSRACAEAAPRLKAFSDRHPEVRLAFVYVESDRARAQAFAARAGIVGPALLDKLEQIAAAYGVAAEEKMRLPRSFLVDAGGKVRAIYAVEGDDFAQALEMDVEAAKAMAQPEGAGK